ncbi:MULTISPECIES: 6-phosphogluconolactonase [unclassified Rhizobium]|uniref:6-phosphogluconolactonase n=1 Tax=unclassified Rhizobium TaxID=2613769 RepID=UPI001AE12321|nr:MULTISPECIES: 6-phosphogluconolactonase [unclassified Rhizobium]MBP2463900.1 glucosamine-6-phosphate deaminase [Rhizobium sp. PvP014]MBP2532127.1 glucosamine-6-phosphate deaminase [Rhizobium sp. PvP099]
MSLTTPLRPLPKTRRTFDQLAVESFATRAQMGAAAAADIAAALAERLASQPTVRMVFAAAPSQGDMLAALATVPGLDWNRVTAFHMDEYIGLDPASPARFANWLDAHVFNRLPFAAVHRITPEPNAEAEVARYATLMNEAPIDIVCLGIGVNGHIAFNDPPVADFEDPLDVKVVVLDDICRQQQVDDDCFPDFASVPHQAVTLTVPRLVRAERLFCVVPGSIKREAVARTLYGPIATECPASILRNHPACTLYIDKDSDPDA